jgi:hypothetical protein
MYIYADEELATLNKIFLCNNRGVIHNDSLLHADCRRFTNIIGGFKIELKRVS